jgi:hypothetical protein
MKYNQIWVIVELLIRKARLVLNQYTASLRVLNDTGAEITSISPYKDGNIYYQRNIMEC